MSTSAIPSEKLTTNNFYKKWQWKVWLILVLELVENSQIHIFTQLPVHKKCNLGEIESFFGIESLKYGLLTIF